jgi:hypothetical protein
MIVIYGMSERISHLNYNPNQETRVMMLDKTVT